MKTELRYYDIFPKVVPQGKPVEITVKPLGAQACFGTDAVEVRVCPLNGRAYPALGGRVALGATYQVVPDADGALRFTHVFEGEQEHFVRISGPRDVKLSVYSLAEDLQGLIPLKGDQHVHTCRSDGKEAPPVVAANLRREGYDYVAITDHHNFSGSLEAIDAYKDAPVGLCLMTGEEVHLPDCPLHIVNMGSRYSVNALLDSTAARVEKKNPGILARGDNAWRAVPGCTCPEAMTNEQFHETIEAFAKTLDPIPEDLLRFVYAGFVWICEQVRKAGGLSIFAHPYWIDGVFHADERLTDYLFQQHPFDAFEVLGGERYYEMNGLQTVHYYDARRRGMNFPIVGSSDSHGTVNNPAAFIAKTIAFARANLTNDNHGSLKPAVAKEWSSPDGGKTWIFNLRDDASWVDYQGNYMTDCVADDFLWGLEFILNAAKNEAANTSMPIEMIVGAGDYYELTKAMEADEAMKLGLDLFKETVAMKAEDDYTLVVECVEPLAYFPTLAPYCALSPVSGDLLADLGAEGYLNVTFDKLWYNGPYTITEYVQGNQKVFTKNPEWYGYADGHNTFDTVTVKMVESGDVAFQLYDAGEIDYVALTQSNLDIIYKDEANKYHDKLVEARPTKYSYSMKFCWDKKNEDGTPDVNWNTAIANTAFRRALYYGIDWTTYLGRINSINPLSCVNYAYTANAVSTVSSGADYTSLVLDRLGLSYASETYQRYDAEKFAQYKAQAMEELTALGVTFPVVCDYYISGSSQTAKDTADVMKQTFSDYLGDDFMVLNIKTYVSSIAKEVRNPQLASIYISGWGADFGDPVNFMGQETYADDNAYFSISYNKINQVEEGVTANGTADLIEIYKTFTEKVNAAKAITGDQDARFAAFADAEQYHIENVIALPMYYNVEWQLSKVNNYSKVYCAYGMQATRYVDWETDDAGYTTAQYNEFKAAYEAE